MFNWKWAEDVGGNGGDGEGGDGNGGGVYDDEDDEDQPSIWDDRQRYPFVGTPSRGAVKCLDMIPHPRL